MYVSSFNACAETFRSGGTYIIRSAMNNNYVFDVYYGSIEELRGRNLQLFHYHGGDNQQFIISEVKMKNKGTWFKIVNVKTNKAVDVAGGIAGDEVNVQVWEQNGTDAQLFRFEDAGNGYLYIKNKLGYYLDVYWGQCKDEQNIQTCRKNGGNNQKWKLTFASNNNVISNQEVLNASWEVDLSSKIRFKSIPVKALGDVVNHSGYSSPSGNFFDVPIPGQKYLARLDYIDADTVFEMLRQKSLNKSMLDEIKGLIAGNAKNAGIEKAGSIILTRIGLKNVPGISTIVGVLEILATSSSKKDWNNFAKTAQNGRGIKKYTYVNFTTQILPRNPFKSYEAYTSYKTYKYEVWDGKTLSEESGYTGIWTKRFK